MMSTLTLAAATAVIAASAQAAGSTTHQCSSGKDVSCEIRCARALGDQCLITHVKFSGRNLKADSKLFTARFLTCKNANVDLQLKSIEVEVENTGDNQGSTIISALASSTVSDTKLSEKRTTVLQPGLSRNRVARIPFEGLLNSGEREIEVSAKLAQCGDGNAGCKISGKLEAVTDPNIRCEFHDTTKAGAFRPASLETSPSMTNSQKPVGQIGPN